MRRSSAYERLVDEKNKRIGILSALVLANGNQMFN